MAHNIYVGGHAIINIDVYQQYVTQAIGRSMGLNSDQKAELEKHVQSLTAQLKPIGESHADETAAILNALKQVTEAASKPAAERKKSMLELSAKALKDAAELVKDIAPTVLSTALTVGRFIVGLAS
jgi:hypothetical protein